MIIDQDFRIRTDPITGEKEKWDVGYKRRWMALVRTTALAVMGARGLQPFPKNRALAVGCLFFMPKSASCKLPYPSQAPDQDNLIYAVRNALKRTPDRHGQQGAYPNGICFWDDDQVIWTAQPDGEIWATRDEPPGVLITMFDYEKYPILQLVGGKELGTQQCLTL
jgi:hypothetical protein